MSSFSWAKTDTRWYLGVRCQKCRVPILFALDRGDGTEASTSPSAGKLVLTCTTEKCRHRADYTAAAVFRFQKQADNPNKIVRTNESSKGRKRKQ